ncbi:glycoside hydrolase family 15 protein [Cellulomonas sp. zg-ZUI188]|uniref:Glycoside hydrolase family 15 protein n=1 Tax=Cellulomonas fengjieae TaxID=2819978 RepID=A0ABS3SIY9_9CELL|nr:glycoside hydrolase family 15 protein [Cellulomonas fengjieae]QVI67572.1 glycoside hydrolase family 15 protein [Cellulomonas fengjieae]
MRSTSANSRARRRAGPRAAGHAQRVNSRDALIDPPLVPIEDYAVLGDGKTAALVSLRGSVDWLCLPHFDSAACFARLLGDPGNGRWLLTVRDATTVTRRYLDDSFVLETTYETPTGTAVAQETMPLNDGRADLVRRLVCTRGSIEVEHEWVVRFGYGAVEPWVQHIEDADGNDAIRAIAGPDSLLLRGDRLPTPDGHRHTDRFTLQEGESVELALTWTQSWAPVPPRLTIEARIDATRISWGLWARSCPYTGTYREAVVRSLLVLRLLTDSETGGIVAAATTSLPEDFGGERNWDYRYSWLRDAAMTLEALLEQGYRDEATEWRDWLLRAVAGGPSDLQIMYRVDGARDLPERELTHLSGYAGSRPVRVGNAAVDQVQNDVLGEVMLALELAREEGLTETSSSWSLQCHLLEELLRRWREPDRGIWEVRGERKHFTHSKVMAWAAVDRAVRAVEKHGLDGPVERWREERDAIHADVLAHGWDAERGTFVQFYGAGHTDAALLQLAQVDFLPAHDPRILSTLAAIRAELEVAPGLLRRYRTEHTDDGLEGDEHAFLACSFWLADALARSDDLDGATEVLDTLVGLANDVGLLAEQYDPVGRRMAGNVPQALSHLALVRAVHSHDQALERSGR